MDNKHSQKNKPRYFNPRRERTSSQCVCCGSDNLKSSPAILMPFVAHRVFDWAPVVVDESWGLETIKNGNAYSICNSLYCLDCRFLFLDIRFSKKELSRLYDDYRGPQYTSLRESYEPGYSLSNDNLNAGVDFIENVEKFLEAHLSFPLTILDWGGDTGKNTPFKNNNKVFDIYDISNKNVIDGAKIVNKDEAFSKKYKLIVCSNVLEHVPYPSDLLFDILNTMDKDSILYIEVPLEDIIFNNEKDSHLKKKHWHEHINFYSEKSLKRLVENVMLEIVDLRKLKVNTGASASYIFQVACRIKSN